MIPPHPGARIAIKGDASLIAVIGVVIVIGVIG